MSAAINVLLSFLIYASLAVLAHASVSRDDDDQIAGISGASSNKRPTLQLSDPTFIEQDTHEASNLSSTLAAATNVQTLKDIKDLRPYFKEGFLLIKPSTSATILNYATLYKAAFEKYDGMIALKGWGEIDDLQGLLKLLYSFTTLAGAKCYKNTWDTDTAIKVLSKALQFYPNLSTLDLQESVLNDKQVSKLLAGKRQNNPASLTSLKIQTNSLSSKMLSELKSTYSNANIAVDILYQNAPNQTLSPTVTFQAINSNNNIEENTKILPLTQSFKKLTSEDILDALIKVKTKAVSIEEFAAFLKDDQSLTVLALNADWIGAEGATVLAAALKTLTSLKVLNLRDSQIRPEGLRALTPSLEALTSLTELHLSFNQLGNEGAKILGCTLKSLASLTWLDISCNLIGDEGAIVFAPSLRVLASLTTLHLYSNRIGDEGVIALAPSLKVMTSLTTLYLSGNQIKDKGAVALASSLKALTNIKELYLFGNQIGDEGIVTLALSMKALTSLVTFDLSFNKISDNGKRALANLYYRPSLSFKY